MRSQKSTPGSRTGRTHSPDAAVPVPPKPWVLSAPIERWDEAIPMGNGLMGTLLWGHGNRLNLSLDRGDLWDLRPTERLLQPDWTWQTLRRLVAEGKQDQIVEMFDKPYNAPYPTKIPAGRLEVTLDRSAVVTSFDLDLHQALGAARWRGGSCQAFCSAAAKVGLALVKGSGARIRIVPPAFGAATGGQGRGLRPGDLATLGYPAPELGRRGTVRWAFQRGVDSFAFAIVAGTRKAGRDILIAYTVACTNDGPDPVAIGRERVEEALAAGFRAMRQPHARWWKAFWSKSSVRLPDAALQRHYEIVQYFYGAASRRGAPPIPLQGVWTADEGRLPPWKGDYHHDLNTQLTYWAYLAADHLDEGLCFLDFLWDLLPRARRFAREFYGAPGACLPGVAALDGQPLGGWAQYTVVPVNSAWLAHAFYLHWRYTMDRSFLQDRAYPWCAEVGTCIEALLEEGPDGMLKIPLSASPEFHDNKLKAWMRPNTTYDLALLRWLFSALAEMAGELGDARAEERWRKTLDRLEGFAVVEGGHWPHDHALKLSPDEHLTETHRHMSHLMPIHPLGLIHVEAGDRDRQIVEGSLRQLDYLGTGLWCGYSFGWMACIAARARQPEKARTMLQTFVKAFVSRNGFHLNGDFRNQGFSLFKYRPFTLEGNFAAAQGVHEMLLQSWGGVVRVFPAVSCEWPDVSFEGLRAEGGLKVSARRQGGETVWVRIVADVAGVIRMRNPFGSRARPRWSRKGVRLVGEDYVMTLKEGESMEAAV